ncbi:MAG: CotH kinase family protein [Lachnospiraceae bacterium]|nr:CotH kinase family protein [Lachnospiraceae bacterium]
MKNKLTVAVFISMFIISACNANTLNEDVDTVAFEVTSGIELSLETSTEAETTIAETTHLETSEAVSTTPEETEPLETTRSLPENYLEQAKSMPDADTSTVIIQYANKKESIQKTNDRIASIYNIPCINITTQDAKTVNSTEYYVPAVIDVFNCDEAYMLSAAGGVRLRGNSTSNGWNEEKPYRIKFETKQNMLGLHGGEKFKSWVLLMAQWNVAMDYTGFNLAEVILDDYIYSSDCTYVMLYINGEYCGLHVLCEQNQAIEGRVEVLEEDLNSLNPLKPDEMGYYLEIDNNADEEHPFFTLDYDEVTITDYSGTTRAMDHENITIKSDILTTDQYDFISSYTANIYRILYNACVNDTALMFDDDYNLVSAEGIYTPQEAVNAVIDVDSFVNMTLLYELIQDYDIGAGSFYFAIDFSENSTYPKFTCTSPWDFNWAYGENPDKNFYACTWQKIQNDKWDRSNIWLITPMTATWYQDMVAERWRILSESGVLEEVLDDITATVIGLDKEYGDQPWKVDGALNVVQYVKDRIKFLDKQFLDS